jgi:hypothetical protein
MKNISRFILLLAFILIVGSVFLLAKWDIPAPVIEVEKVIPNDQFPK